MNKQYAYKVDEFYAKLKKPGDTHDFFGSRAKSDAQYAQAWGYKTGRRIAFNKISDSHYRVTFMNWDEKSKLNTKIKSFPPTSKPTNQDLVTVNKLVTIKTAPKAKTVIQKFEETYNLSIIPVSEDQYTLTGIFIPLTVMSNLKVSTTISQINKQRGTKYRTTKRDIEGTWGTLIYRSN